MKQEEGIFIDSQEAKQHVRKFVATNSMDPSKQKLEKSKKNHCLTTTFLVPGRNKENVEIHETSLPNDFDLEYGTKRKEKKPSVARRSSDEENHKCCFMTCDYSLLPGLEEDMALDILARTSRIDYPILACVSKRFKELIKSGYLYKLRKQLGITEYWVYTACLMEIWEAFDPVRKKWIELPAIPCGPFFLLGYRESLAVGTELLIFGQEIFEPIIWSYSLVTHSWSRGHPMEQPRCLFGSASLGGIAIVAGGVTSEGSILKSAELYNSESGRWFRLPHMSRPRKMCSALFMEGKFYVIGGLSTPDDPLACGEEYDLETSTWKRIEGMYPLPKVSNPTFTSPPLVAVVNNQLYSADLATNEVKRYNKANNTWTTVKLLPVRADFSRGWGIAFKALGNSLLVIGGIKRGAPGEAIALHTWNPQDINMDLRLWDLIFVKRGVGSFVYNCAIMSC